MAIRQLPYSKQHRVGRHLTASSDRLPLVTAMLGLALLCRFFVLRYVKATAEFTPAPNYPALLIRPVALAWDRLPMFATRG
jgi:hypothetical protein